MVSAPRVFWAEELHEDPRTLPNCIVYRNTLLGSCDSAECATAISIFLSWRSPFFVIRLERIERGVAHPLTCSARLCWICAREERPNFVTLQPPTVFGKEKKKSPSNKYSFMFMYCTVLEYSTETNTRPRPILVSWRIFSRLRCAHMGVDGYTEMGSCPPFVDPRHSL